MLDANPRTVVTRAVAGLAERDIRSILIAIPPVVHSDRDKVGFLPTLIKIARARGVSGYANRWPAAHVLDVGSLYRLALEHAPAGSQLVAATEAGVPVRDIAVTIGEQLNIPAVSIPTQQAAEHLKPFPFMGIDITMPSESTQELLGWRPAHPGLIADLDAGHYFTGN